MGLKKLAITTGAIFGTLGSIAFYTIPNTAPKNNACITTTIDTIEYFETKQSQQYRITDKSGRSITFARTTNQQTLHASKHEPEYYKEQFKPGDTITSTVIPDKNRSNHYWGIDAKTK